MQSSNIGSEAQSAAKCEFCGGTTTDGRHGITWCVSAEDYSMKQGRLSLLPTGKSDRDRAAEARAKLRPLLEECAEIMNAAQRDGFTVTFAFVRDGYGRWTPGMIDCVKPL